jgi:type I restriction enzyme S subunit
MAGETITFGEVAELVRQAIQPKNATGMPYIGLEHIEEGTLHFNGYGQVKDVKSTKFRFSKGDILFGKLRPYFRKVIRAPFDGVCSTDIWVVRAKRGVEQGYLFYWMASQDFVDFATQGSEGTKMPRAKWDHVCRYKQVHLSTDEQHAIAHILGTLDDKIELDRKMNETLETMARAIFKSWFVDFDPIRAKMEGRQPFGMDAKTDALFPNSFQDSLLGKIPKGWSIKPIGDVLELAYGKALKEDNRRPGNVPVYGSNGQVGWHNEALIKGPGIVVGRKGNPGIVTWVPTGFFPIDTTFYVIPKGTINSMYYLFHALSLQDLSSLGADSAVPGLNRNMAYMTEILEPTPEILNVFDKRIGSYYERINVNDTECSNLATIRDTLLPKLISGQIRVKDAEKFVGEVV